MSKNIWVVVIVILVLVGGWYLIYSKNSSETQQVEKVETNLATSSANQNKNTVTVTSNGFSPQNITIKVGESLTWKNETLENHTVNSSSHPAHTDYTPLNLGNIPPSESKSLTFPQKGTFSYHDHLNSSLTGIVKVE